MLKKKVPEWLATTLSILLLGMLLVAYFVFYRPQAGTEAQSLVSNSATSTETAAAVPVAASAFAHPFTIGDAKLMVAYALTPAVQAQGLSDTPDLAPDTGMLFVFPSDSVVPFWMKDMRYSLDIVWIGSDGTVKDITPDLAPSTYPNSFVPKVPVRYALEVPAGFAMANHVVIGTKVVLSL